MNSPTTELLHWFDANAREMPWRGSSDPYAILVCEVMSQQTRIDTVVEYWTRWMQRFPSIASLAEAEADEVMRYWAGLGYYRRARNLHACARAVMEECDGELPGSAAELRDLPGIGPYTAAAIASIVHGEAVLALDGNVARVASRFAGVYGDPTKAAFRREVTGVGMELIDPARAGASNEALMELGATVCTPRSPSCAECPLEAQCFARRLDDPTVLPEPKPRKKPREETRRCLVLVRNGAVWMRKGGDELLGGLLEFPAPEDVADVEPTGRGEVVHVFSHIRMTYRVFRADDGIAPTADGQWVALEGVENEALSTAMRKVLAKALE